MPPEVAVLDTMQVAANMGIYWILSFAIFLVLDTYAKKKIGGKQHLGYLILKMPRFFCLLFVSLYTIGVIAVVNFVFHSVSAQTLNFLGVPYFAVWFYFVALVFRRIKAETKGRFGLRR
jgi:hypothetical protein